MSSLTEIVMRSRTIAEGRGVDPHQNPVIDAGMTTEALVPHAIRYAIHNASGEDLLSTTADHSIEVDADGEGDLPEQVLRAFIEESYLPEVPRSAYSQFPDYNRPKFSNLLCYYSTKNAEFHSDCTPNYGTLIKTATASKAGGSDNIVATNESEDFVALEDVGQRLVGRTVAGVEVVNGIIEEVISGTTAKIRDYRTGSIDTVMTGGLVSIYETTLELDRTLSTVDKAGASQTVTADAGEGGATTADIGYLMTIDVGDTPTVRTIITATPTVDSFTIAGYAATAVVDGIARIYRILDPVIIFNVPSLPVMPTDPDADLTLSKTLVDNTVLVLAGALTGEIGIQTLLGHDEQGGDE